MKREVIHPLLTEEQHDIVDNMSDGQARLVGQLLVRLRAAEEVIDGMTGWYDSMGSKSPWQRSHAYREKYPREARAALKPEEGEEHDC